MSNSNSKWLSLGITPTTKILDEDATGFQTEIFLCGDKGAISLGGIDGAATLFKTFRAMPQFATMYTQQKFEFNARARAVENIIVTKANFGNEVIEKYAIYSFKPFTHYVSINLTIYRSTRSLICERLKKVAG